MCTTLSRNTTALKDCRIWYFQAQVECSPSFVICWIIKQISDFKSVTSYGNSYLKKKMELKYMIQLLKIRFYILQNADYNIQTEFTKAYLIFL